MIDMASVYAERYRKNPDVLRAAVVGQSPDSRLDPYTALNALKLVNESNRMAMAMQAQQPTSAPSIVAQNVAPQMGLGAMVPNAMSQTGQAPQGMPPQGMPPQQQAPAPQPTMQAASGGLAGLPTPEYDYAAGGIVAFSGKEGSLVAPAVDANSFDDYMATLATQSGPPSSTALSRAEEALNKYMEFTPKEMSEKEQEAFLDRYMARVKKAGGEDIYAPEIARSAQDDADRAKARRVGEANAYFTAAGKILKGRSLAEGASEALPAFGGAMNEVEKLDQAAKTANARAQFALKDAQRKERMGDARGAQAALSEARKFQQDANRAEGDKLRFSADIAARTVQYSRPPKATGGGDKEPKLNEQLAAAEVAYEKNPSDENKKIVEALRRTVDRVKTTESGPGKLGAQNTQIFVSAAKDASANARKRLYTDPVMRSNDPAATNKRYRELYAEEIQSRFPNAALSELLSQMPAEDLGNVTAPAAGKSKNTAPTSGKSDYSNLWK